MIWRFKIGLDVVAEPVGWDGVSWTAQRHEAHGILFASQTESFKWVDDAFALLQTEYETNGADGALTLTIEYDCNGNQDWQTFFIGDFDFNTYKRFCGDMCWIEIALNPSSCVNKFLARINTDVDLSSITDLDGNIFTPESFESITLNSQTIVLNNAAENDGQDYDETGAWNLTGFRYAFIPVYLPKTSFNEFGIFNANGAVEQLYSKDTAGSIVWDDSEDFLTITQNLAIWQREADPLNCIDNDAAVGYRIKGEFRFTPQFNCTLETDLWLDKFDTNELYSGGTPRTNIWQDDIGTVGRAVSSGVTDSVNFDIIQGPTTIAYEEAEYLLFYFRVFVNKTTSSGSADNYQVEIIFDSVTNFTMELQSDCEASQAFGLQLSGAFTNIMTSYIGENCVDIGAPLTCANYHLTNGGLIRAITTPSVPKVFTNFEDLFKNISKIFNLGWGFYADESKLTVREMDFFYSDTLIVDFGSAREIAFTHAADLTFGKINVGYSKWEAEEYNGIDEVNTKRTFRRNEATIANELDLITDIITAGYTIEITRRKNQAKTGTQDWRYDNDLFLINTEDVYGYVQAVQGNIESPLNIVSPETRYNYLLTPIRNLMRWFKSICTVNPTVADAELQFQSGTGNYLASGEVRDDCAPENSSVAENETITQSDFENSIDALPLWLPIYMEFEIPVSVADFLAIKADPYGYYRVSCGGTEYQGYLVEINYRPNTGKATVKLLWKKTPIQTSKILLESGDFILLESGDKILLE